MSRAAKSLRTDIASLTTYLTEIGFVDASKLPIIKPLAGNMWDVCLSDPESVSSSFSYLNYKEFYNEIANSGNYNLKLLDGSIVTFQYRYNKELLIKHRVCYFPFVNDITKSNIKDIDDIFEEISIDKTDSDINPDDAEGIDDKILSPEQIIENSISVSDNVFKFPIRFDYDPESFKLITHSASHVHVGFNSDSRIPVSAPISPRDFILFILRSFYQDFLVDNPSSADSIYSQPLFSKDIHENEEKCIHLSIPSVQKN